MTTSDRSGHLAHMKGDHSICAFPSFLSIESLTTSGRSGHLAHHVAICLSSMKWDRSVRHLARNASDGASSAFSVASSEPFEEVATLPVKRRKHRHGSLGDLASKAHLPNGPMSVQELFNYPSDIVATLFKDADREHHARELLGEGLFETSDYSGMHCEGEAKRLLFQAIWNVSGWKPKFNVVSRCCDNAALPQKVLVAASHEIHDSHSCVMTDIHSYINAEGNAVIDLIEPAEGEGSVAERADRYRKIEEWIMMNKSSLFTPGRTCICLVHEGECPVQGRSLSEFLAAPEVEESSPDLRPLILNSAGTVCKDWSSVGVRSGFSGKSERTHATWLGERSVQAGNGSEDMFFSECTKLYDFIQKLAKPLQRTHTVIAVKIGPDIFGHPTRRTRNLAAGLSQKTLIWIGPPQAEIQDHFESIFARKTLLTGAAYFRASPEALRQFAQKAMMKRGLRLDVDELLDLPTTGMEFLDTFLPPGAHQRLEAYEQQRESLQGMDGTYIVDLEQWPQSKAGAGGPYFPSQLTHGSVLDVNTMKYALGTDHLAANGFHTDSGISRDYRSLLAPILQGLSSHEQKELSGNGQSLPAIAAWFLYVFCHTVRRPQLTLPNVPSEEIDLCDDDEDEEEQASRGKFMMRALQLAMCPTVESVASGSICSGRDDAEALAEFASGRDDPEGFPETAEETEALADLASGRDDPGGFPQMDFGHVAEEEFVEEDEASHHHSDESDKESEVWEDGQS